MQWVCYLGEMENTRIWLRLTICSLWIVLTISEIFKTIPSRPNSCLGQHHSLHQTWIRCFRSLDAKHKVLKFLSPSHALLHFLLHIVLVNLRICVWFPNRLLEILASSWGFFYCNCTTQTITKLRLPWNLNFHPLSDCRPAFLEHGLGWFHTEMLWWVFHCCKRVY